MNAATPSAVDTSAAIAATLAPSPRRGAQFRRGLLQAIAASRRERDVAAFGRERPCARVTESAAAAGNGSDLPRELQIHATLVTDYASAPATRTAAPGPPARNVNQ